VASRYTHAGGVVFRESPSGPEYLIVEARRSPGTWVLPKGHIEDGETAEQAAVREVQEEAGSDALVLGRIGSIEFETVRVAFFLMRHRRDVPPDERRRLKWCTCEEAQRRVSFEDIRQLLQKAHVRVSKGAKSTKVAKVPGNVRARGA
jgi:8-oxo-dGTP pyrophosphatase MutT (NUDIX family)